jgi:hypothetical protein
MLNGDQSPKPLRWQVPIHHKSDDEQLVNHTQHDCQKNKNATLQVAILE